MLVDDCCLLIGCICFALQQPSQQRQWQGWQRSGAIGLAFGDGTVKAKLMKAKRSVTGLLSRERMLSVNRASLESASHGVSYF
jgi:hypothetical protein